MATASQITQYPVTCIRLSGPGSRRAENITHIGGVAGGQHWEWSRAQVIEVLESPRPRYAFYVDHGRQRAYVRVFEIGSVKYIRTEADGVPTNNLEYLALR